MKIDGKFLSNLRFAGDIFLCTETPQDLQHMLQELSDESRGMGQWRMQQPVEGGGGVQGPFRAER